MATFESKDAALQDLLRDIKEGKIQLPDFQRGWIWDDNHIRDLLVSIGRSFPIGAVMLLQVGGEVRFQTRLVEGVAKELPDGAEKLILDGQQRLTTLTQALSLAEPTRTRTARGKEIKRHYYFDIYKAVSAPYALEEAIVAVDENKQLRSDFGRSVDLDLSSQERECEGLFFPCCQIMDSQYSDQWEEKLLEVNRDSHSTYMKFRGQVIQSFREYRLPVILLQKEISKEAVCLVFEKVNTGGVQLSVFELITASYAAEGYNLRDDWFGSTRRNVPSRKENLEKKPLLKGIEATEFLQAVSLLHTHELQKQDIADGKKDKQLKPVSAKRKDVLQLPLCAWKDWSDRLTEGFRQVASFLQEECFYSRRELPYSTQLIPLAAIMTRLGEQWREPRIREKLARWFWSGVLGELYGGAVETRMANDYIEVLRWIDDDDALPRTVRDANFQAERFDSLRSRNSAAYKGISVLVLREGSKDWFWKARIRDLDAAEIVLDIHHIFPSSWCKNRDIDRSKFDSILNKTPISYKANRKIGGDAPSRYVARIQREEQVALSDDEMDELLSSHALSADLLRQDEFDQFLDDRRQRLSKLIETAMGKPVSEISEAAT